MSQTLGQGTAASLTDLLKQCTVKLSIPELYPPQHGTGFFVAPNLILTCNHVVSGLASVKCMEGKTVKVRWQNHENLMDATVFKAIPDPVDLALLSFEQKAGFQFPHVYFDADVKSHQKLYSFGYPDKDFPNGLPISLEYVGLTGDTPPYMIFNRDQVSRGMSGSALLNESAAKICGIIKFTRDANSPTGGGGVSAQTILSELPEIAQYQQGFVQEEFGWRIFLGMPEIDQNDLLDRLSSCPAGIFRKVTAYLKPPAGTFSSENSSQAIRAAELLEWATHSDGCGLENLHKAYLRAIGKVGS